jgi:hypothetical protein
VAVSFIGRGNRIKLPTCCKSLKSLMLYTLPWSGFELTTSVVIGTDCMSSCKSNYHTITAMTAPRMNIDDFASLTLTIRGFVFWHCSWFGAKTIVWICCWKRTLNVVGNTTGYKTITDYQGLIKVRALFRNTLLMKCSCYLYCLVYMLLLLSVKFRIHTLRIFLFMDSICALLCLIPVI